MDKHVVLIFDPAETSGGAFNRAVEMSSYLPHHHYIFLTLKPFEKLYEGIEPPSCEKIRIYSFISATQIFELRKMVLNTFPKWLHGLCNFATNAIFKVNKEFINIQVRLLLINKSISVVQSNNGIHIVPYKISINKNAQLIYYFRDWQYFSHYPEKMIKRASYYFFVGKNLMERYFSCMEFDKQRCHIVHSPFDVYERLKNESTYIDSVIENQKKLGKKIIVCASRISEEKGQHLLILSALHLVKKRYKFHIVFIGEASNLAKDQKYIKKLKSMVEENQLYPYVSFLGHKNNPLHYIRSSDISVQAPTYFEALAGSLVESAQLGIITISADIGGANEIIIDNKTGFLFKPNDEYDLTEKLGYCLDHFEDIDALRLQGRKHAIEKWNPNLIKLKINDAYRGVL